MSHLIPHTSYAEDQPHAHTILTTHVLYRGFQTGATVGLAISSLQTALRRRFSAMRVLRVTGQSSLVVATLMVPGLYVRMRGRDEIEWKDRSWRLLENRGQMEVDDFSVPGTVVGAVLGGVRGLGLVRSVGCAGVGSVIGVGLYMGWRYGVNGGKWEEDVEVR